jgi:hypothetical protein
MGTACSTHGGNEKLIKRFSWKSRREKKSLANFWVKQWIMLKYR